MGLLGPALYFEALLLPLAIRLWFRLRGVPRTQKALRKWAMRGTAPVIDTRRVIAAAWLEFEGQPVNDDPAWFDAPPRRQ